MKHINFTSQIKTLHKEIVNEIINLMNEHNVTEVDLLGSDADHAYITGWPNGDEVMILEVNKAFIKDGKLKLDVILDVDTDELAESNENGDISEAYQVFDANDFLAFIPCAGISDVYDTIYDILKDE